MSEEIELAPRHEMAAPMTHEGEIGHMIRLAETLAKARGIVPDYLQGNPGNIVAVLLTGRELGLSPMASLRGLHLVKGKVGLDYSTMVALLRRHGYRIEWPESGPERVTLQLTHPDGSEHVETWDKARAKTAGLWGQRGPWSSYPETMLRARCVSSAGRAFAGDVLAGVYSTEEAREIARAKGAPMPDGPAEIEAEPVAAHPLVERIDALGAEYAADMLRADAARAYVWAAVQTAQRQGVSREVKGAMMVATRDLVAVIDPDLDANGVKGLAARWLTEPPRDRTEPEDAEIVGEEAAQ